MNNSERFHKAKALISEAKKLLEPIKDDLLKAHNGKFQVLYDKPSPTSNECDQLSDAANTVISMICDLEEIEQESIAIPL